MLGNKVVGQFSTSDAQIPAGLGEGNSIVIHFGDGGDTVNGEFSVGSDGKIRSNQNSGLWDMEVVIRLARNNAAGVSFLVGRMMYAEDGVDENAEQLGSVFTIKVDDADTIWREVVSLRGVNPASNSLFWFEIGRDPAGNDSGEISTFAPSGDMSDWVPASCSSLTISAQ